LTSRAVSLTTNARRAGAPQRSSSTIDASAGPTASATRARVVCSTRPTRCRPGPWPLPGQCRHEARLEHHHGYPAGARPLQLVRVIEDGELGVGIGDPPCSTVAGTSTRWAWQVHRIAPIRGRDSQHPTKMFLVVRNFDPAGTTQRVDKRSRVGSPMSCACARWFTAKVSSYPSAARCGCRRPRHPALATSARSGRSAPTSSRSLASRPALRTSARRAKVAADCVHSRAGRLGILQPPRSALDLPATSSKRAGAGRLATPSVAARPSPPVGR